MFKKLLPLLAVGAMLAVAQEPDKSKSQADKDIKGRPTAQETITGCLTENQGTYMIAGPKGEQFTITGKTDLSKHKNHTVRVMGKRDTEGAHPTFDVSSVEHVSPTCPAN